MPSTEEISKRQREELQERHAALTGEPKAIEQWLIDAQAYVVFETCRRVAIAVKKGEPPWTQ